MLDFVAKLSETPNKVGEPDRDVLRKQKFSEADIWDICEVAGLFAMSNRLSSGVDMMPNPEYHAAAR